LEFIETSDGFFRKSGVDDSAIALSRMMHYLRKTATVILISLSATSGLVASSHGHSDVFPGAPVNAAPVAVNDESYDYENITQFGNVSLNDSDPNGDVLTYTVIEFPEHGTITMQPNGQFQFVPDFLYYGFDYVTYQVCDPSGLCATAILEIAVLFVNDPPTIVDETFFVSAGMPFTGSVRLNDFDIDDEPIFYNTLVAPSNVTGFSMSMFGIVTFTPNPGFTGTITLVYQGCDPCVVCDIGVATFIVMNNQPPVAQNDSHFTSLNTPLDLTVAQNDSDPDGNPLIYSVVSGPSHGTIVMQSNGSYLYTPVDYYSGMDYITYQVCDPFGACDQATLSIEVVFVNVNPVGEDDTFTMNEDGVLNGDVSINDYDLNIEVLTYFLIAPPSVGTMNWNMQTGQFTYTPPANWSGNVTAVYNVCDPCNACDVAVVSITVNPVNDPPMASDGSFATNEDIAVNGSLSSLFTDLETTSPVFSVQTSPSSGTLNLQANGTFTYTPALHFFGTVNFTYSACDAGGLCDSGVIAITVNAVNDAPVVASESFSTNEDVLLNGNVAANDSDPDNDGLTYSVVSGPSSGALTLQPNGTFTYMPALDFNGTVSFVYQACDPSGLCGTATATIGIGAVNDVPVAQDGAFTTAEDTPLVESLDPLATDAENSLLTFTALTNPSSGTLVVNANGSFTYTPVLHFNGNVSFTYSSCDALGLCDNGVVTITVTAVNDAPVVQGESYSVNEDNVLNNNVALNDSDAETSALTYTLIASTQNGALTLNTNGTFTYSPALNYNGPDSFQYQACDAGGLCGTATAQIMVNWINDLPVAEDDSFTINEDQVLNGTVSTNDSDIDIEPLFYSTLIAPTQGTVSMQTNGNFTYAPPLNFNGFVTFLYLTCDSCNACDAGLVSVLVLPVNDAPIAQNDLFSGTVDIVLSGSVATNDSDPEGDQRTYTLITPPSSGTLSLTISGSFTYTPALNFFGTVQATYQVCDMHGACSQAVLTIQLSAVNDPPVAVGETNAAIMNTTLTGNVSGNDSDPEAGVLTYALVTPPSSGVFTLQANGSYMFEPATNFSGQVNAVYSVCDPQGACTNATLVINVISTNTNPVILSETVNGSEDTTLAGAVSSNDSDPDDQPLVYTFTNASVNGVFTGNDNGTFTFVPSANWFGVVVIGYQACDPIGACASAELTLVVASENDYPVALEDQISTTEDDPVSSTVAPNASDVDDETLFFSVLDGPSNGVITMNADGGYTYTPDPNFFGTDELTYRVCDDNNACAEAVLTINVIFVNDPPIAGDDQFYLSMNELLTGSVGENDIEIDPEPLAFTLSQAASNGSFVLDTDGTFTYIPNDGFVGMDIVVYTACDPCGACDTGVIELVVGAVNSAPVVSSGTGAICENGEWTMDLDQLVFDAEDPNSALTITVSESAAGIWNLNQDTHVVTFIPFEGYTGQALTTFEVCDVTLGTLCSSGELAVEVLAMSSPQVVASEVTPVSCFGLADGAIDLETDGEGTQCIWSNGFETEDLYDLPAGVYTVTLMRPGFCMTESVIEFEVSQPSELIVEGLTALPINENAGGSSDYTLAGGTLPYTFEWINLGTGEVVSEDQQLTGLADADLAGGYQLTVIQEIVVSGVSNEVPVDILIYPNPFREDIVISVPSGLRVEGFRIFDLSGREVMTGGRNALVSGSVNRLNMAGFAAGSYLLEIRTSSGNRTVLIERM
jgi:VCBS repeat-containing protein